ncbi:MAG: hypothetical protein KJP06_01290, partial [Deltaproteobacteria bacterium]|nr:hypothetical protein [Deltaproteobacteria bacterium]
MKRLSATIYRVLTTVTLGSVFLLLTLSCRSAPGEPAPESTRELEKNVYVIGHRGSAGLMPENTLAGFSRACELGVDAVELDVLVSADGEIVVYHDFRLKPDLTRKPDGLWLNSGLPPAIRDLQLADLKRYDVGRLKPGSRYSRRYPEQQSADGERI